MCVCHAAAARPARALTSTAARGKFEIPGYPHKLGLLLHGPPGTGKTSLIKVQPQQQTATRKPHQQQQPAASADAARSIAPPTHSCRLPIVGAARSSTPPRLEPQALAEKTGRNVVNVPLGRIKTNQELMGMMFDPSFSVPGMESPVKLEFSKTIFVMEDVDAASKVVLERRLAEMARWRIRIWRRND